MDSFIYKTTPECADCRDPLTGVGNRRHFRHELEKALSAPERHTALLLLDIDHFSRINDEHGFAVGDAVLRELGKILLEFSSDTLSVARVGGEAFAAVLAGHPQAQALMIAESIRERVARMTIEDPVTRTTVADLSTSVGVASRLPGEPRERLLRRADAALSKAKNGGRNRVRIAA